MAQFKIKPLVRKNPPKQVLILGGGIAGLVAGYELDKAGHNVSILEARMNAGGRIKTLREPFTDGLYAEAGAARIPDNHHWTFHYIKHFGLETAPFYPDKGDFIHYCQGKSIRIEDEKKTILGQYPFDFTPEEKQMSLSQVWQKVFSPFLQEIGDTSSLHWPDEPLKKYDRMTVSEFLNSQNISDNVAKMFGFGHMNFSQEKISALEILRLIGFGIRENQKLKIVGGADKLPNAFVNELKGKINYGAKVIGIEQKDSQVNVIYEQGGFKHNINTDYLICTIPFSVLRHIKISPSFSTPKNRAIQEMSYMNASRVFFQVKERYWLDKGLNGFGLADYPTELWHSTFDIPQKRGILVSYMKGFSSRKITAMEEVERISYAKSQIDSMLSGLDNYIENSFSFNWDEDEYAQGAHSFLNVGEVTELLPHSAYPEGRIHFAGEHTSAWHGWIQGAIESGYRAAEEINSL